MRFASTGNFRLWIQPVGESLRESNPLQLPRLIDGQ
jgi:hypothetical protein